MLRTPWHGGPICCAVRLCWFSLVPGDGAGADTIRFEMIFVRWKTP
jgi:hypothetical protein